ncbi:hypothetical protein ABZP36_027688 [Zizania latifolia]
MAVSTRLPAPPARGLLRRASPCILPVERPPRRRLAPGVRAVSGIPGPGGSPVPRRPPAPTIKRKGWINHSIKGPESIADHIYRMALMALIAGDLPAVDRERCIKIAIVHDIAEADEIKELWEEYENNASIEAKWPTV